MREAETEGKIEGDGTFGCPGPYLHEGWRGTAFDWPRAASRGKCVSALAFSRALCDAIRCGAPESAR